MSVQLARMDGLHLAYEVSGSGEPVVCIHGALIADTFHPLLGEPGLTSRYRLISYHRRGHAGSGSASGSLSIEQHAADCLALLHAWEIERAHFVGHSYGGTVALQLALSSPEVVHSLVLLEPALFVGTSAEGYRLALNGARDRYRQAGGAVVVHEFLTARWPGYRATLDRVLPGAFDEATNDAKTFFEYELPGLFQWQFGPAESHRITQPTLSVLGGGNDLPGSRFTQVHEHMVTELPHAEGRILPGATHFLQVQDPGGVAAILAEFWSRHPLQDQ